jgi:hypothetical protein
VISFVVGREERLPEPLLERFPELREARYRRGGVPPRVAGWCLGQRSVAAITLWKTIWLGRHASLDAELLLHELRHVAQFRASRFFPILYLWESLRRGYWNNRYEIDAREYARQRAGSISTSRRAHLSGPGHHSG